MARAYSFLDDLDRITSLKYTPSEGTLLSLGRLLAVKIL